MGVRHEEMVQESADPRVLLEWTTFFRDGLYSKITCVNKTPVPVKS